MTTPVKIEQMDLEGAVDIRRKFTEITMQYGKLQFAKRVIEKQQSEVEEQFDELTQTEEKYLKSLHEKYGVGSLDMETGIFTPIEEK